MILRKRFNDGKIPQASKKQLSVPRALSVIEGETFHDILLGLPYIS
jgi:hypothetical protein